MKKGKVIINLICLVVTLVSVYIYSKTENEYAMMACVLEGMIFAVPLAIRLVKKSNKADAERYRNFQASLYSKDPRTYRSEMLRNQYEMVELERQRVAAAQAAQRAAEQAAQAAQNAEQAAQRGRRR